MGGGAREKGYTSHFSHFPSPLLYGKGGKKRPRHTITTRFHVKRASIGTCSNCTLLHRPPTCRASADPVRPAAQAHSRSAPPRSICNLFFHLFPDDLSKASAFVYLLFPPLFRLNRTHSPIQSSLHCSKQWSIVKMKMDHC